MIEFPDVLLFQTFQVNIFAVSTLETVAIQNELHNISHSSTCIYPHNYVLVCSIDPSEIIHYCNPPIRLHQGNTVI